jgi:hypothetical protein
LGLEGDPCVPLKLWTTHMPCRMRGRKKDWNQTKVINAWPSLRVAVLFLCRSLSRWRTPFEWGLENRGQIKVSAEHNLKCCKGTCLFTTWPGQSIYSMKPVSSAVKWA